MIFCVLINHVSSQAEGAEHPQGACGISGEAEGTRH
jgi:hypothetical protein